MSKSVRELRHQVAEKVLSLKGEYTIEEIVKIVYKECNISDKQKEYALDAIDDVIDLHWEPVFGTDKYRPIC